jgi:uncharacterized protein YeaO (DUF488 family)
MFVDSIPHFEQLVSLLSYVVAVVFGVVIKTAFDYLRGKQLLQKEKQYQREQKIDEWEIDLHRAVKPFPDVYSDINPKNTEDREQFQEFVSEFVEELDDLYDNRPYRLDEQKSKQFQQVIDAAESYLDINPRSKPVLIRNDPIGERPFTRQEYQKGFDKRTKELREELQKLLELTN